MKALKSVTETAVYTGHTDGTVDVESSDEDDDCSEDPGEELELPLVEEIIADASSASEDESDCLIPPYFLYDCEGTGGSIYTEHIIEIAAVVQPLPEHVHISSPQQFQSLVYTAKQIAPIGKTV